MNEWILKNDHTAKYVTDSDAMSWSVSIATWYDTGGEEFKR